MVRLYLKIPLNFRLPFCWVDIIQTLDAWIIMLDPLPDSVISVFVSLSISSLRVFHTNFTEVSSRL